MRVLIIGSGGREHALGWKIAQSPLLTELFFAPGNPGTADLGRNLDLATDEIPAFAQREKIDLVVVGPEQPLVDGLADRLEEKGICCFGPKAAAARLEGSKDFSKQVMVATGIPTAAYQTFTDYQQALDYVRQASHPLVVKADGLAAGKGVTICHRLCESEMALRESMMDGRFGAAGAMVVIEEFLVGTEASFHIISDGLNCLPVITAKDHKAHGDGDTGPNTGGMGTYAPSPLINQELADEIVDSIGKPVFEYLSERGCPFRGVLFVGLMLTANGPKVLEFNVRFGDPETQVILPMLDYDLLPVLAGAARGALPMDREYGSKKGAAVCVVLAAAGYPDLARKGDIISGPMTDPQGQVFLAGVRTDESGNLVTSGGRVLGVTAWDESVQAAKARAYRMVEKINFDGRYCRRDIGGSHE